MWEGVQTSGPGWGNSFESGCARRRPGCPCPLLSPLSSRRHLVEVQYHNRGTPWVRWCRWCLGANAPRAGSCSSGYSTRLHRPPHAWVCGVGFRASPALCGCLPARKIHELIGELVRMVPCVLSRFGNEIQRHKHAGMPHVDHRHGWDKQNLSKCLIWRQCTRNAWACAADTEISSRIH